MYYIDPLYYYYALPGLILGLIAQLLISIRYNKYSKVSAGTHMSGLDAAELIKDREEFPVDIATNQGKLQDNFDPRRDIVNISSDNIRSDSIANIAVVAHEFGHVDQKFSSSFIFKLRTFMVPVVNIGSNLGYILFFVGLILNALNLAEIGLILFASTTIFALVTLPVEFNASKRGLKFIKKYSLIEEDKQSSAKKVLSAAALTYVASFVTSLLNLLYYVNLLQGRKKNE